MDYICLRSIECNQGAVRSVRYNVDGNYCITCGSDKKLKLWNPTKGILLNTYAGHANEVLDADSSCDNSQIVSCGIDKTIILWDVVKSQPLRRLRGHAGKISSVIFNEDSTAILSGSDDNTVMCWDIKSRQNTPVQILKDANDCITKVEVTDHEILSSSLDCKIRRYDIRIGELIEDFVGESLISMSLTSDEQCVLVSCNDDTIKLFDKNTGDLLAEYSGHTTGKYFVESCVDNSDSFVFSGSTDGTIWCYDLIKMNSVSQLVHNNAAVVHSLSSHPNKKFLLSASKSEIKVWISSSIKNDETCLEFASEK